MPLHERPLEFLWQPRALTGLALSGIGLALVLTLTPADIGDRLVFFGLAALGIMWVILLTLTGLYLARHRLDRLQPVQIAWVALGLWLLSTWLLAGAAWLAWPGGMTLPEALRIAALLTLLALTVGLLGIAAFQSHWRNRTLGLRARQAELEALQARIRPHFLFNTLNTGAALVHQQPEAVEQLLLDLSDLFRAALAGPHQVSLEDELGLARRYLEIESLRFRSRLEVEWKLPREIPDVTVPALTVQPLVENAIRHGIERRPEGGRVEIVVSTTPEMVIVRISNPLPPEGLASRPGHQVGLNASQVRIEALTDGRGSVLTQRENGRFVATVRLPLSGEG
ncbi:sensor histidine kinase [Marilutibacter alkalisoli]|uniref:Sensor histidine kinase n=1 Tax=Marilutibacter alkalisoli TaxID=2591633 RepID=A0A514BPX4_9GAMM|nr:histidine kinase [Lysobacter alkalisoli]QDH69428.1 sensor histidine kinase [Lysobacter alkalisoli]